MLDSHVLVVTPDADDPTDSDLFSYAVECPGVTPACEGWIQCDRDGCDPEELDALAVAGEWRSHGLVHRLIDGTWMTRTGYCAVANSDGMPDEVAGRFKPGRHSIDFDFGDSDRDITILGDGDSRPRLLGGES